MLIILTGPPGAGKTTIGALLAEHFPKSVNFSLDTVRHFVKGGYVAPWNDTEETGQLALATDVAMAMVEKYLEKGYVVVIDDVIGDAGIEAYAARFGSVSAFLLMPSLETVVQRDAGRPEGERMGSRAAELYAKFAGRQNRMFTVIDSTGQDPEETLRHIIKLLPKQLS